MFEVDPRISFALGIVITGAIGISSGALGLDNAIPADWIPTVKAWNSIIAFYGSAIVTALHGVSSNRSGPLAR